MNVTEANLRRFMEDQGRDPEEIEDTVDLEACPHCGTRAERVCDSLPPALCETAVNATFGGWLDELNQRTLS